jgi:hypothetical protein
VPPVDEALAESDALVDVVDFALADDDALFVGFDEALVDTWPCPGARLVQLGLGVGGALFLADLLGLGLALVLALADVVGVAVAEPPGLALGVSLPLGLRLALPDGLELSPAVLLLVLPLEDVAGAEVVAVVPLAGPLLVDVADACVDGDGQALDEGGPIAAALLAGTPLDAEGVRGVVL